MIGLTIQEVKQAGNRVISTDIGCWTMKTIYGKNTINFWCSYDTGRTWVNTGCNWVG